MREGVNGSLGGVVAAIRSAQSSWTSTVREGKAARRKYALKPGESRHPSALAWAKMARWMGGICEPKGVVEWEVEKRDVGVRECVENVDGENVPDQNAHVPRMSSATR